MPGNNIIDRIEEFYLQLDAKRNQAILEFTEVFSKLSQGIIIDKSTLSFLPSTLPEDISNKQHQDFLDEAISTIKRVREFDIEHKESYKAYIVELLEGMGGKVNIQMGKKPHPYYCPETDTVYLVSGRFFFRQAFWPTMSHEMTHKTNFTSAGARYKNLIATISNKMELKIDEETGRIEAQKSLKQRYQRLKHNGKLTIKAMKQALGVIMEEEGLSNKMIFLNTLVLAAIPFDPVICKIIEKLIEKEEERGEEDIEEVTVLLIKMEEEIEGVTDELSSLLKTLLDHQEDQSLYLLGDYIKEYSKNTEMRKFLGSALSVSLAYTPSVVLNEIGPRVFEYIISKGKRYPNLLSVLKKYQGQNFLTIFKTITQNQKNVLTEVCPKTVQEYNEIYEYLISKIDESINIH